MTIIARFNFPNFYSRVVSKLKTLVVQQRSRAPGGGGDSVGILEKS